MQAAATTGVRKMLDRAHQIASERGVRATTLHFVAAVFEQGGDAARVLTERGVRAEDLRSASKVHPEGAGVFERVQSAAKRLAHQHGTEVSTVHLLVAALYDKDSALARTARQLGCDAGALGDEVLRAPSRPKSAPAPRAPIVHSGSGSAGSRATPVPPAPQAPVHASPKRTEPDASTRPARNNSHARTTGTTGARMPVDLDPRMHPALARSARNLTAESARGTLEPVVGRTREADRVLDAIGRRDGRGALVVGAAGVGKSTLLRALAKRSTDRAVLVLRHADIAAQCRQPQGLERLRRLVEECGSVGDRTIIALDPVAPWFLTRDLPDEIVLEMRAALSAGSLAWVGTASAEEARRLTEVEPWIERATLRVDLEEPDASTLREILRVTAPSIVKHHAVKIDEAVLDHAADLSERFLGGRAQPERTLAVIDLALARAKRHKASSLGRTHVAEVVADLGGLPLDRIAATDAERMLALEGHLADRVVGHTTALARIARTLRRNAAGFRGARPIGTFLFLGPTGVGKTECAKAIADVLFPGAGVITRFDMAEFAEAHTVSRLVGAPPGYVGHHDGGQLTEAVRRRPYQLVLLDEIEKAHRDVLESLLALLDEGRMTDGRGRTVDFRHTVIVMTSNLGSEAFDAKESVAKSRSIGFGAQPPANDAPTGEALAARVMNAARASVPPEFWNRIDEPIVFGALARPEVAEVARRMLDRTFARLAAEQGVRVTFDDAVIEFLLDEGGFDPTLGARPMKRTIARVVEGPVADALLGGVVTRGATARLVVDRANSAVVLAAG